MSTDLAFVLDQRLAADTYVIGDLELSRVLLMNDSRFPWVILVPRRTNLRELIDLSREDQHALLDEINHVGNFLRAHENPDKLNFAALGNVVAQLHVHIIARFRTDAAWPRPIWGVGTSEPYSASVLNARVNAIRTALRLKPSE
jgi:diadenosine tetraphosphate (Ap4A) HIT family hydrolase